MKKFYNSSAGFTLIELIVVFAITAVLAGVGIVTYTGYVERANKASDQQNVANLIYAAQLADYADSTLFGDDGSAAILITDDNCYVVYGPSGLESALEDSVGDLSAIKLRYTDWNGADLTTLQSALSDYQTLVNNTGGVTASFSESVNELWSSVEDYLSSDAIKTLISNPQSQYYDMTDSELLAAVAAYTADTSNSVVTTWYTPETFGGGNGISYSAAMARNYSVMEYAVSKNYGLSDAAVSALKSIDAAVFDAAYSIHSNNTGSNTVWDTLKTSYNVTDSDYTILKTVLSDYFTAKINSTDNTQAYIDAVAYYGIMKTVNDSTIENNSESGTHSTSDSDYLDTVASYVTVSSAVLSGSLSDAESAVTITATKANGTLSFTVSPSEADVGDWANRSISNSDTEGGENQEYTEYSVGYLAFTFTLTNSLNFSLPDGTSNSFTTTTPYKVTVTGGTSASVNVSGSGDTWTWTPTSVIAGGVTGTFTLTLEDGASGITISGCEITAEQGASGTVKVTLNTTNDLTGTALITFTSGN